MKAFAYYNEFDPKTADWLRELIKANLIAPGEVDERSIEDVKPADLLGFRQCHFFAGIGGWSYALRLANWPDDKEVWTGSCPCQPFSAAGKGNGFDDERHLWPAFYWLIKQCQPQTIFGEQVAAKDGITWLDSVSTDMENENYAIGPVVLPACGFGAPHARARTFFVANSNTHRLGKKSIGQFSNQKHNSESRGEIMSLVNSEIKRNRPHDRKSRSSDELSKQIRGRSVFDRLANSECDGRQGRLWGGGE